MSKPHPAARPNRRPEGDAESELRDHRKACQRCRAAKGNAAMCPQGRHLANKLGLREGNQ